MWQSRAQLLWKYVPQRLHAAFPHMRFYLITDDDVFINPRQLLSFVRRRDPTELAIYGPGFCDWGVRRKHKEMIAATLGVTLPQFLHIVIGGIMLFTHAAVKQFSDATVLMRCIDDLETLYANRIKLWDGLKDSAMYNQDWLFCWCLQVRMGGTVHLDNAFEDIEFPHRKCLSISDASRELVGTHHTNPRRMRALWRAHERRETNATANVGGMAMALAAPMGKDPSRPQDCRMDASLGRPYAHLPWKRRRRVENLPRPVHPEKCISAVGDSITREQYPQCVAHMRYVRAHPETSPCNGPFGREACEGFQLDRADPCSVQYYLFCERLYKPPTTQSWCPAPAGYPRHCCYGCAMGVSTLSSDEKPGAKRRRAAKPPHSYLNQVYPERPVFDDEAQRRDEDDEDD